MMLLPSVAQVEDAELFSRCIDSRSAVATEVCHAILPAIASNLICSRSPLPCRADVMKSLSFHTTCEEWPSTGRAHFQAILFVSDQVMGGADSALIPSPRGPRN